MVMVGGARSHKLSCRHRGSGIQQPVTSKCADFWGSDHLALPLAAPRPSLTHARPTLFQRDYPALFAPLRTER